MSELKDHVKLFEKAAEALKKVVKPLPEASEELPLIEAALATLQRVDLAGAVHDLRAREIVVRAELDAKFAARRQDLETKARQAGLSYRRSARSDKIANLEVEYSNRKVKILVGSEELTTFEEIDGAKVIERIQTELDRLKGMLLPREIFFGVLKTAFLMARSEGKMYEKKVKIREIYPYVATVRQLTSEGFRKKPSAKLYVDYSLAMLTYEFACFGDHPSGWCCGEERICNQGPSMSNQNEAVLLPSISNNPTQLLYLWLE